MDPAERSDAAQQSPKIFVGNLGYRSGVEGLRNLFGKVGRVESVSVPIDYRHDGRNLGFAFVEMTRLEDAKQAKEVLEGAELDGRRLHLEWAKS
jgi:RNA recognition motif-containing protein